MYEMTERSCSSNPFLTPPSQVNGMRRTARKHIAPTRAMTGRQMGMKSGMGFRKTGSEYLLPSNEGGLRRVGSLGHGIGET